jgi:hypothetical protein
MPKEFTISDAITGSGNDFYDEYFGGDFNTEHIGQVLMIVLLIIVVLFILKKLFIENATNSNASVALVEFSAGSVGGNTSAPIDLYNSSVYARNLQDNDKMSYNQLNPNAAPGQPGSASYIVLNSDIMGCSKTDLSGNPWAWWLTDNRDVLKEVARHPAVVAAKQAVLASKPQEIAMSPEVQAAKQAVISANPSLANQPVVVEQSPAVVAAKDAALNANADVKNVVQAVLAQPTVKVAKEGLAAAASDQCPTIGKRMGDEPLTKAMMGY